MTKWPLMSSPMPIISISLVYLYVIYIAAPNFMKNRPPYTLKTFIQCYNVFQVIVNSWLVYIAIMYGKPLAAVWRYCDTFDEIYGANSGKVQVRLN